MSVRWSTGLASHCSGLMKNGVPTAVPVCVRCWPLSARGLGQAEVRDLDRAVGGAHEVGRLDVAVDQAGGVGGADALAGVDQRLRRLQHRQRLIAGDAVGEAAAGDEFQHEVMRRSLLADFVDARRRWGG